MTNLLNFSQWEAWFQTAVNWAMVNVLGPRAGLQVILLTVTFIVAWLLGRVLRPRIERKLSESNAALLSMPIVKVALRQIVKTLFLGFLLVVIGVMMSVTWPSASYLLRVAATLLATWLVIRFASVSIRKPALSRFIAVSVWVVVALHITNLFDPTVAMLDRLAIELGALRISALVVVQGTLSLALLIWCAVAVSRLLEGWINQIRDLSPSVQVLLGKVLRITLFSLAVLLALKAVGIDLTGLAIFSGAVGIGIGFGLQKVVSNLISGMIILLDKSIKPGDVIELGETFGWISSLGGRYVSVVTREGKEYLIPNEEFITQRVVNWSYTNRLVRLETKIRASYDNDPHLVRKIACEAAAKPGRVVNNPKPLCHLCTFGDSSLQFFLRFWIQDPQNGVINITGEVLLAVWDAFRENGIQIPYPKHEVFLQESVRELKATEQAVSPKSGALG